MTAKTENNSKPATLGFVLAVTFILSIGTGSLTHGLGFIAKEAAGFHRSSLFGLGIIFGITYIISSALTGPVVRRLESNQKAATTPKTLLLLITFAGACVSAIPPILGALGTSSGVGFWLVAAGYGGLTGIMWPIVEWYISGGRTGEKLRSAAGQFNIVWTTAVVLAFWLLGPMIQSRPLSAFVGIVALHIAAMLLMFGFPSKPPRHTSEHIEHNTHNSKRLLAAARTLLPVSYTLAGVLGPFFPIAMASMDIDLAWKTAIVSVWMTTRIPIMVILERWHGWHGKGWPLAVGAATLILGFVGCVIAPLLLAEQTAVVVMVIALVAFGVGKGMIYTAAIYYAMEVGQGEIDSGATHESLIGVGYTLGPAIGLAASIAITVNIIPESGFAPLLLGIATIACMVLAGLILVVNRRKS